MTILDQAAADMTNIFPEISRRYDVYLHGVLAFDIAGRYDAGGRMQALNDVEMVISKPAFVVMPVDAPRLTKDHTIRTEDGDLKIFGGGLRNGLGLISFELVKR